MSTNNSKISVSDESAVIRREVRLLRQPNWIAIPLFDLLRSGQVELIKNMPRPEEGNVPWICYHIPSGSVPENLQIVDSIQKT